MSRGDDGGTLAQEAVLTHELIEGIQDEDEGFECLEEFSIDTTGAADIHDIKRFLRIALRDKSKENFKCVKCDLKRTELDDFENQYDVVMGCKLLEEHFIPSDGVTTVSQVKDLFEEHLQLKENLEPYDLSEVAEVVKTLMEQNTQGRLKMLRKYGMLKDFVSRIPSERQEDISNQLPDLDSDMQHVYSMLNKDNCTIMIAGETGAGKTCLLNLLLGELGADLLPVSNLPQTSAVCEIKYDTERYLKAYPVDQSKCAETVPLSRTNAAEKISEYVADKAEERNVKYSRVEVYWPCEWIQHGITITDTPGVGESEEFTKVVKDYIPKASGFIYVINTPNAGGINSEELGDLLFYHITREGIREDKDVPFGQQLQEKVHFDPRSAVFVCNKWDQVPTAEQQEVKDYVKDRLQKVWRDFDFETQVFFISIKQVAKEIQSGYVPQEYRRLLSGIQNLLPIGFKARMERQFWKMYHIMDRSMWVLNNYIRCDEKTERQVKKDQYRNAKKRLQELEKRPKKAKKKKVPTATLR